MCSCSSTRPAAPPRPPASRGRCSRRRICSMSPSPAAWPSSPSSGEPQHGRQIPPNWRPPPLRKPELRTALPDPQHGERAMTKTAKTQAPLTLTRDAWLTTFIEMARPIFSSTGKQIPPNVRAAICPPHRNKQRYVGLCWSDKVSEDNGREIWITAGETDPAEVAGILVHELCHAALPHKVKHGKAFRILATTLGLEGKMTATTEGEAFKLRWGPILDRLGPLPAARFTAGYAVDVRVQKTPKMTNMACPECGFVAKVRLDQMHIGRLVCPEHGTRLLRPRE